MEVTVLNSCDTDIYGDISWVYTQGCAYFRLTARGIPLRIRKPDGPRHIHATGHDPGRSAVPTLRRATSSPVDLRSVL